MTEVTTSKTVTLDEIQLLSNLRNYIVSWRSSGAHDISIEYDKEYNDFLVTTGETNVRKGRISKLQAEITAWAENEIRNFGYMNKKVSELVMTVTGDNVGITLGFEPVAA